MWYQVSGEREQDDGAATVSRAVLVIALLVFLGCLTQSVLSVMEGIRHVGPLNGAAEVTTQP